jgi:DNA-directed RNA polymerase subunit H
VGGGKVTGRSELGAKLVFSGWRDVSLKEEEKERSYNLFNHQLVPKHELLSKKEAEELMKDFHIRPHQLPYIITSDPAVEALGGKMGDILRITRKSPTAGEVVVYRYVVDG